MRAFVLLLLLATQAHADEPPWVVWEKTSPCVNGRQEWMTVAKDYPSPHGPNAYVVAGGYLSTTDFANAMAQANTLRTGERYLNVCCRTWSVWFRASDKKFSVVLGMGNPGMGWSIDKGDLCCEEAEARAGIPGACSGNTGPGGSFAGVWKTDFGEVTLSQSEDGTVTGHYALQGGSITGKLAGKVLTFAWTQSGNHRSGTGVFTLADDGQSFTGSWQYNDKSLGKGGGWTGKRVRQ